MLLRSPWFVGALAGVLVLLLLAIGWASTLPPGESHSYDLAAVAVTDRPVIVVNQTLRDEAPDLVRALQNAAAEGEWTVRSFPFRKQLHETILASGVGPNLGPFDVAFQVDGILVEIVNGRIAN